MKKYYEFLKPNYIYIPFNDRSLLNIKLNMYVYNNQQLGKLKTNENIYSTCSGKLINLQTVETSQGSMNSMVIENDFREKRKKLIGIKRNILTYTKEEMINKLDEYSLNYFNNIDNLIILIEYTKDIDNSDSYTLKENIDEILETIDGLNSILNLKNTIIVANNHDKNSVNVITDYIGTYPNIKFKTVSKEYNSDTYEVLKRKIFKKENNVLILTLDKLYEIYFALKKNKTLNSKVITISNNKQITNVNVKINTSVKELLEYLKMSSNKVYLMKDKQKEVNLNNAVITKELKAIIIK